MAATKVKTRPFLPGKLLPEFSWNILLRYAVRAVLFPILPAILLVYACYSWARWFIQLLQGYMQTSDAYPGVTFKPRLPKEIVPYLSSYESLYFTTRDGTRIAVDIWLPINALRRPVSIVLHQARYYRAARMSFPIHNLRANKPWNLVSQEYFESLLSLGIGVVAFDVRGSGASFGTHHSPWREEEEQDALEILDWVLKQSWCNGRIGTFGVSYEATAGLMTTLKHPAVLACAPLYPFLDIFSDVGFMGGLCLDYFIGLWQAFNNSLDSNNMQRFSWLSWLFFDHVMPVNGQEHLLKDAIKEHAKNWDCTAEMNFIEYVDDVSPVSGMSPQTAGPYNRFNTWVQEKKRAAAAGEEPHVPAFYIMSGWYDTSAACAIRMSKQLEGLTETTLVLGPWNHSGTQHVRTFPKSSTSLSKFKPYNEVAAFFSRVLDGPGAKTDRASAVAPLCDRPNVVRYFAMQAERWRSADTFPLPVASDRSSSMVLYLGDPDHMLRSRVMNGGRRMVEACGLSLALNSPSEHVRASLNADPKQDVGSHGCSRYHSMVQPYDLISYSMEGAHINHLRFTSKVLAEDVEVTGFPIVSLYVSSSTNDASIFVYLECVDGDGRGHYVTEGVMRASNRVEIEPKKDDVLHLAGVPAHAFLKESAVPLPPSEPSLVRVMLQPTSFCFKRGQRIRVSVAGADAGHFSCPSLSSRYTLSVHMGPDCPSSIYLPTPDCDALDGQFRPSLELGECGQ